MIRSLVPRRRQTFLERALGRRRVRRLRRRVGFAAVGTGLVLLRPTRARVAQAIVICVSIGLTVALVR